MFCLIIEILSLFFVNLTPQTEHEFNTNLLKDGAFLERFKLLHFATMFLNVIQVN
jgi:hypothetical protein